MTSEERAILVRKSSARGLSAAAYIMWLIERDRTVGA